MLLSCDNTERAALRYLKWATHDFWEWPVEEDEGLNMSRTFPGTIMITRHGGSTEARAPVFRHPAAPSVSNTETGYYNLCIPIGKCSPRICQLNFIHRPETPWSGPVCLCGKTCQRLSAANDGRGSREPRGAGVYVIDIHLKCMIPSLSWKY